MRLNLIIKTIILFKVISVNAKEPCEVHQIANTSGQINVGLIVQTCNEFGFKSPLTSSLLYSAVWTIERANFLNLTFPFSIGFRAYQVCLETDYYNTIYNLFKQSEESNLIGVVTSELPSSKINDFSEVLGVRLRHVVNNCEDLVKAAVKLMISLNWRENITVFYKNGLILQDFYKLTMKEWICVEKVFRLEEQTIDLIPNISGSNVIIGTGPEIELFLDSFNFSSKLATVQFIFVPLDGSQLRELPPGSYFIQPPFAKYEQIAPKHKKLIPTPLFFQVASPILKYVASINITNFVDENCNETTYKLNCFHSKWSPNFNDHNELSFASILDLLQIEPLAPSFVYNIFRVTNVSFTKLELNSVVEEQKNYSLPSLSPIFVYYIFNETIAELESFSEEVNSSNSTVPTKSCLEQPNHCTQTCINFQPQTFLKSISTTIAPKIYLRPQAWVFAFLSISLLGVIFCISILIFFWVCLCKRNILEGNPGLTILLLLTVMLIYCTVIPFALVGDTNTTKYYICLARSLSLTLSFAFAFSLLLGRCVLLATVSKEIEFMSHIPGPVQSFLTLFMFAVQGALSLQLINNCEGMFHGISFLYVMSYNIILLTLLVCMCPLIAKSLRNYKEGRYFTVAILLTTCVWICWITGYILLEEEWKDPMICFGAIATASVLLSTIFIPRTYQMTIAATRDQLTSVLPALSSTTSAIDMYRASTQPLYDCINVATVNAVAINGISAPHPHPVNFYSTPGNEIPYEDDDFETVRCETPTSPNKVTRF